MHTPKKRIVIIGAGFAGLYTYKHFRSLNKDSNVEISLINATNYFLFTPMLHEVATGGLGQHSITFPVRDVLYKNLDVFFQTSVLSIDLDSNKVETTNGELFYDYLVISTGSTTNFYNISGAEDNSYTLKSLEDAVKLRSHFIDIFERASHEVDDLKRHAFLTFSVIGAGPTGVELIAEMAEYFYGTFDKIYGSSECLECRNDVCLNLISSSALLPGFSTKSQEVATKTLRDKGINIMLNKKVARVSATAITFEDGDTLDTHTTIWTAGVKPNLPKLKGNVNYSKGRIVTKKTLQLEHYKNVFALGDVATLLESENKSVPMLAQAATKGAKVAANNLNALVNNTSLASFDFHLEGMLVSLGQWAASGTIKGVSISGKFAWWLWRTVYLSKLLSWSKRFKVALDWTINIFTKRDISKLN